MQTGDTIAAVATARGAAALAVVRLSGPDSVAIAARCFEGSGDLTTSAGRTVHVGRMLGVDGEPLDHVVATVFRSPSSPTGEDVVEFSCHGGSVAPRLILETLLDCGARMADAGEFTQRAFVNGKLDLAQAEAVADLIHARTSRAHGIALRQLNGRFSVLLGRLRDELLELCGYVELELDFSDTDQVFADSQRLRGILKQVSATIGSLLSQSRSGELVRDGVRVVISGRPNAGKSTLLNALVGSDRAIVSETAGTTRDLVEADLEIDGFLYRLVDTAGLRESSDLIEEEGVRRARKASGEADIIVYVYDATVGLSPEEVAWLEQLSGDGRQHGILVVANKDDLARSAVGQSEPMGSASGTGIPELAVPDADPRWRSIRLSARFAMADERALEPMMSALMAVAEPLLRGAEASPVLLNARHVSHLRLALAAVERAEAGLDSGVSGDFLAQDLRIALHELGCIIGEVTNEDVLDTIFSRFCIGK